MNLTKCHETMNAMPTTTATQCIYLSPKNLKRIVWTMNLKKCMNYEISKSMKSVNNEHANVLAESKALKKYIWMYMTLCQVWIYKCNVLMSSIGSPKIIKTKSHSFTCHICCQMRYELEINHKITYYWAILKMPENMPRCCVDIKNLQWLSTMNGS